ncbi:hypothetical protein HPP92_004436 [Vanilla planifolia]|uniref:Uncharacterized protein n=1 Tax=Vanilla planifolia TaxID=51239 RepID=A0A835RWB7_VANPL|nr:hypothetical protein HPP92_004436 [Vanilla planifolia]
MMVWLSWDWRKTCHYQMECLPIFVKEGMEVQHHDIKVTEAGSLIGKVGTAGFGRAVEVLDTISSGMTNLNKNSGFSSGVASKANKISILAFEVANTIVKGANLMHSLSEKNVKYIKDVVLPSEAVQQLISKEMDELLRIAAVDKREELKVFSGEVVRFGNLCKDPQWHNLDRYFAKLESEHSQPQFEVQIAEVMQQLMALVQLTAELYHELHTLDRLDREYRQKFHGEGKVGSFQGGEEHLILWKDLKSQKKHVNRLKKRSLWSWSLEEVMENFVDIVHFFHFEIHRAFGSSDRNKAAKESYNNHRRLGPLGLALHYANIINQIYTLVLRSDSFPSSTRDSLYHNLPPSIKSALRCRLQVFQNNEELSPAQIKAEMEKKLRWLVPMADNTTKAHHGFGWVGEWACAGTEVSHKHAGPFNPIRIETLYHAEKEMTDACIVELITWLHQLISLSRPGKSFFPRSPAKSPIRFTLPKYVSTTASLPSDPCPTTSSSSALTLEDQELIRGIKVDEMAPGISKSQEFAVGMPRLRKHHRLNKSSNHSPVSELKHEPKKKPLFPIAVFEKDPGKALDAIEDY